MKIKKTYIIKKKIKKSIWAHLGQDAKYLTSLWYQGDYVLK
jgi:hypothetical protein